MERSTLKDVQAPLNEAPKDVREVARKVLMAEQEKLYLERPHIISDLVQIVKETVK